MKKIISFFLVLLVLMNILLPMRSYALVTTEGTAQTEPVYADDGKEDGMVRGADISAPIAGCFVALGACIVYGVVKLRKNKGGGL